LIESAAERSEQFVMGMAHRGRLNVLAIYLENLTRHFGEFDGKDYDKEYFDGDVSGARKT
jgi:2-oxoglutarate dehydrogenase E1 component